MANRCGSSGAVLVVTFALSRLANAQGLQPPAAASSTPPGASASPPASAPPGAASSAPPAPSPAALQAAKALFLRGNELLEAREPERALDLFLRSRALVPSIANTTNAGLSLERLGRLDEALDMYEELLASFAERLTEQERTALAAKVAQLRAQVSTLEVSANVEGTLVVDGRRRGTVPLSAPVRVAPGLHVVRVLRDGYTPAEATITAARGQNIRVDLKLDALTAVGRLHVTDASNTPELEVLIDGSPLGPVPWEGSLGPGRHVVQLRGREAGTAPVAVNVLAGQTVPLALRASPLGPSLRVEVDPRSAQIALDGVEVSRGIWEGRLPVGPHAAEAWEEGYQRERISFTPGGPRTARVALQIDEGHPRWRQGARATLSVEGVLGATIGPGLGSAAEAACPGRCSGSATGGLAGARLVYALPVGLRLEAGGGYLQTSRPFTRSVDAGAPGSPTFVLDDEIRLAGPYAALGVGFGYRLSGGASGKSTVRALGRLSLGAFFARSSDVVTGVATGGGESAPVNVARSGKAASGATVFAMPELGLELTSGRLSVGFGLGVGFFLLDGPTLSNGEITPATSPLTPGAPPCTAERAACFRGSNAIAQERAYGRFVLFVPQLSAGWAF
jgi:hypothetical protein